MSIALLNMIKGVQEEIREAEERMKKVAKGLNDRMDRIEYRKKPGPKPARLKEKLNDK